MLIKGKYNEAKIFTTNIESEACNQIRALCDMENFKDSQIRIMPDVHAGAGCTIGTTMTITDAVVPNMVGVDISCGLEVAVLADKHIDFAALDSVIREHIPYGRNVRKEMHPYAEDLPLEDLACANYIDLARGRLSVGSLGSGNHMLEVAQGEDGTYYLYAHSGSRHLGLEVANYYQNAAYEHLCGASKDQIASLIKEMKASGKAKEISKAVAELKKTAKQKKVNKETAYVTGSLFDDYIHDMFIVQKFATANRKVMIDEIVTHMGFDVVDSFTTIHNYIEVDVKPMVLRKGAVSAKKGEKLIIPLNMRDGALICKGKGNPDWNFSAPHGAGRAMSRGVAKRTLDLTEYAKSMEGIYTTCVGMDTIDEAPMAYKPVRDIVDNIVDTVDVVAHVKPVYNFKASE